MGSWDDLMGQASQPGNQPNQGLPPQLTAPALPQTQPTAPTPQPFGNPAQAPSAPSTSPWNQLMGQPTPKPVGEQLQDLATKGLPHLPNTSMDWVKAQQLAKTPPPLPRQQSPIPLGDQRFLDNSMRSYQPYPGHLPRTPAETMQMMGYLSQNAGSRIGDIIQGSKAAEAAVLKSINESQPHYNPASGQWEQGRDLGDIGSEDATALGGMIPSMVNELYQNYGKPIVEGHPEDIAKHAWYNPVGTALDAWALSPLYGGAVKGAGKLAQRGLQTAGKGIEGLATAGKLGSAIEGHTVAKSLIGDILADMPDEVAQHMMSREKALMDAYNKIPKKVRKYLTVIGEETDPRLTKFKKHPAIRNYFQLQDKFNEPLWKKLIASGYVKESDILASRWYPKWRAAIQRGEVSAPPGINLANSTAQQAYLPEVQQAIKEYRASELAKNPDAELGLYNPVQGHIGLENYWSQRQGKLLGGIKKISTKKSLDKTVGGLEQAVTAPRLKSAVQETNIGGRKVTALTTQGRSFDTPRSMLKKMEQTEKFFLITERLEQATADIVLSPANAQATFNEQFMQRVMPLLGEIGIDANDVAKLQEIANEVNLNLGNEDMLKGFRRALTEAPSELSEVGLVKAYNASVAMQRLISVAEDAVMPFYLFIQQGIFFGTTALKGPKSITNALIAAKAVMQDKDIISKLPRGIGEYRTPLFDNSNNPLLRLFARYQQAGLDGINFVRGTHALTEILNEYDKMGIAGKKFVLRALQTQFEEVKALDLYIKRKEMTLQKGLEDIRAGKTPQARALQAKIVKNVFDIYGKYTGEPTLVAQIAQGGGVLWGRMLSHSLTYITYLLHNNPLGLAAMYHVAEASRKMQQEHNAKAGKTLRGAVTMGGGWLLDVKAPDGSLYVQFPGGWNLLTSALEMPYGSTRFALHIAGVLPTDIGGNEEESGIPLLQWGPAAALIFSGQMPSMDRPIMNPYAYSTDLQRPNQYDLSAIANPSKADPRNIVDHPWTFPSGTEFIDKVLVTGGVSFDRKAWTYLKNLEGGALNIRPSDKTVPMIPGLEYPKVDLKTHKVLSGPGLWPASFIPGGSKIAPTTIRSTTEAEQWYEGQANKPVRLQKHQKSDVRKLREKARAFQKTRPAIEQSRIFARVLPRK